MSKDNGISIMKVDEWQPTEIQVKQLEVMLNPDYVGMPITHKCKLVKVSPEDDGITPQAWYKNLHNENFMALVTKTSLDLVKDKISGIMAATINFALKDPKCHSDRKMLLTMIGAYSEESNINLKTDEPLKAKIAMMSEEQLKVELKRLIAENPDLMAGIENPDNIEK